LAHLAAVSLILLVYGIAYALVGLGMLVALRTRGQLRGAAHSNPDNFDNPSFSITHLLNAASASRFHLPFALIPFITGAGILTSAVAVLLVLFYVGLAEFVVAVLGIVLILPGLYSFEALLYFRAASKSLNSLGHRDVPYVEYFTRWLWAGFGYYLSLGVSMFVLRGFLPLVLVVFFAGMIAYIRLIFWSGLTLFSQGLGFGLGLAAVVAAIIAGWLLVRFILGIGGYFVSRVLKLKLDIPEGDYEGKAREEKK